MTVLPADVARANTIIVPPATSLIHLTPPYAPINLQGMKIYPENPFRFDFIVDPGDSKSSDTSSIREDSEKLIKYFLASVTVPEDDMWVNLSPYEPDKIIPDKFGQTLMGQELLLQDYVLKQMTASLMHPEDRTGQKFWERVYAKAYQLYGTTDIPINTFNKVWIVPERAEVYVYGDIAVVNDSYLKVMVESDYLSQKYHEQNEDAAPTVPERQKSDEFTLKVVKEVIIPELEREVNSGKNFESLRQIYNALILATWFKRNLRETLFAKDYINRNKISGVDTPEKQTNEKIYQEYLKTFKQGTYSFIKEDYDPYAQEVRVRKFFAGGISFFGFIDKVFKQVVEPAWAPRLVKRASGSFSSFFKVKTVVISEKGLNWYNQLVRDSSLFASAVRARLTASYSSLEDRLSRVYGAVSIKKLGGVIASALVVSVLAFSPSSQAAEYSFSSDHQKLTVTVEKGDTFGEILYRLKTEQAQADPAHNGSLEGNLWGRGGSVERLAQMLSVNPHRIYPGQKFELSTGPQKAVSAETAVKLTGGHLDSPSVSVIHPMLYPFV